MSLPLPRSHGKISKLNPSARHITEGIGSPPSGKATRVDTSAHVSSPPSVTIKGSMENAPSSVSIKPSSLINARRPPSGVPTAVQYDCSRCQ